MIWDQLTTKQLAKLNRNIPVLLNIAATEQHGPHLPLATDRIIGEHFAALLNKEMNDNILILPSVQVGCSDHHMGFVGSLSLSHCTFSAVVKDIITSVLKHGFRKIILLNSHGGNQGIMQVITEELGYANPNANIIGITWWNLVKDELRNITETGPGGTGHACEFETSLLLVIAPDLVGKTQIENGANVATFDWAEGDMLHAGKASYYRTMKSMTSNGVFGDPTLASAEKGVKISECVILALKQLAMDVYKMEGNSY
ncbi:creatininase family protein [Arenibacter algicola]|uniref:creatininase family protein n=1 Tax=Arenibacter algicola TaxID=616991 RepID=UPI001C06D838|nr:creatininase family protein [Arenibacter algicola]MBU2904090.1 creatininase family protein [Arenibacter algicola]